MRVYVVTQVLSVVDGRADSIVQKVFAKERDAKRYVKDKPSYYYYGYEVE